MTIMILAIDPQDRSKPEWPLCVYREKALYYLICAHGEAIEHHKLKRPDMETIRELRLYKPQLTQFGKLTTPETCRNCHYRIG